MSEMSNSSPDEVAEPSRAFISRLGVAGTALIVAYGAIGAGLWLLLGGIEYFPRILLAVCSPAVLLSVGLGLYLLIVPDHPTTRQ
jgi:hypothetical protein